MDLEVDRPRRDQRDVEYTRWVLDAKVRVCACLCQLQSSGKGDEGNRQAIAILAKQVIALAGLTESRAMDEVSDERRRLIDDLSGSISKLCHAVIRKRLEQFFEVIGDEMIKERARLLDALNREPGESYVEWETRARAVRSSVSATTTQPGESK